MIAKVLPSTIQGDITAPASKSAMQRACAASLIRNGDTVLHNPGVSADDCAALEIIRQLGATVTRAADTISISGRGVIPVGHQIHCGESGLSIRMFTSIAALSSEEISVTGSGSLLKRPMEFFDEVLPQLGVSVTSENGFLPLQLRGPLVPKDITIDGSLSSQFLTGLLFAYAAANASDVTIAVRNLNSKPYIDLTLQVLEAFGLKCPENNNYETFYFSKKALNPSTAKPLNFTVEGDWSGGAFLLVAGAVAGNVAVRGLDISSSQADKAILEVLMQTGAQISIQQDEISVSRSPLKAFRFNATDCPDLFPPLVALASFCKGTSVIEGTHRLTHKESNRAATLQEEFGKLGVQVSFQGDLMMVEGGTTVKEANVHSHHDHRIAMACAVAALRATGPVCIEVAEAVNKSYPNFWDHMKKLHSQITLSDN